MILTPHQQEVALARFAVIAPLVTRSLSPAERTAIRRSILAGPHPLAAGELRMISARTVGRWVEDYMAALPLGTVAALSALAPKGRSDKGIPRVFSPEVLEEAIRLRHELTTRSTVDLLAHLEHAPKEATLAYHLRKRGATRTAIQARGQAFPRYEADAVNATWQSDVTEGFWLPDPADPTKRKQAYLMGFLDDHSRLIAHGEWYFKESLPCLFDCLKKAVLKRGVPSTLYWDNGPIYRSKQVALLAARLGTRIVFSTPYAPEGKGKIERFWQTMARGFLQEAAHAGLETLAQLNEHFWAWLDGYHQRVHASTDMTPLARWEAGAAQVRRPQPADLAESFLWEEIRLVKKTGTLSLAGNEYRVSDELVGNKVAVRYDPLDMSVVRVYREGAFAEIAAPYRMTAHTHRKATPRRQDAKYLPLPSSKRLLAAQDAARRQDVDTELATLADPVETGARLTKRTWLRLLGDSLDCTLAEPDQEAAGAFFRRYAPLYQPEIQEALRTMIARWGTERHLAFYLAELRRFLTGGRA